MTSHQKPSMERMPTSLVLGNSPQRQPTKRHMNLSAELQVKNFHKKWKSYFQQTKQTWKTVAKQRQRNQVKQKWRQRKAPGALSPMTRHQKPSMEQTPTSSVLGNSPQRQPTKRHMNLSAELQVKNFHKKWKSYFQQTKQTWKTVAKQRQRNQVKQKWRQRKAHGALSPTTRHLKPSMEQTHTS